MATTQYSERQAARPPRASAQPEAGRRQSDSEQKLTPKGQATRERILEAAAMLIYQQGAHLTNNEDVRRRAGVSGSQLTRHFPNKESLVRGVIRWRADRVLDAHHRMGAFDTVSALREWAESYIDRDDMICGGCSFGALSAEVLKVYPEVRDEAAAGFAHWEKVFRAGLRTMVERGDLVPAADPDQLAHMLLAAFQGGMLLDQAAGDTSALRSALSGVMSYIESFATSYRSASAA